MSVLGLSPEQDATVGAVRHEQEQQQAGARQAAYQRILTTLNEAQRKQYESLIQQQLDRRLAQMTAALDLASEQQSQLRAILTLSDQRFGPSIAGADLTEAIRYILSDEQASWLR